MATKTKIKNQMLETLRDLNYWEVSNEDMALKKEQSHLFFGYRIPVQKNVEVVHITEAEIAAKLSSVFNIKGPFVAHHYYRVSKEFIEVIAAVYLAEQEDVDKIKVGFENIVQKSEESDTDITSEESPIE